MLSELELQTLAEKKASGAAVLVYSALSTHARNTNKVFPSIARICRLLGGAFAERTIYKALAWLEGNGFITRKKAIHKDRFKLILRKAKKAVKRACGKPPAQMGNRPERMGRRRETPTGKRFYSNREHENKSSLQNNHKLAEQHHLLKEPSQSWFERAILFVEGSGPRPEKPHANYIEGVRKKLNDQDCILNKRFGPKIKMAFRKDLELTRVLE